MPSKDNVRLARLIGAPAAALLIATTGAFEGKRNDPYKDVVGVETVCFGETNVAMHHYTDDECRDMLADHLVDYAVPVLRRNPELTGHDDQIIAATDLAYNIGVKNYERSSVARNFSAGKWREACDSFLAWSYAGGRQIAGLLKRRKAERVLCLRNLP